MACTHTAAMSVLATFAGARSYGREVPLKASAAARLMRAYATQVETLRRLRNGGSQVVRVEHARKSDRILAPSRQERGSAFGQPSGPRSGRGLTECRRSAR